MRVKCPYCGKEFIIKSRKKGKRRKFRRDPAQKLLKLIAYLKAQEDWVWLRKIARDLRMSPYNVDYLLTRYLRPFLEIEDFTSFGVKMKLFRLKNKNLDEKSILASISSKSLGKK